MDTPKSLVNIAEMIQRSFHILTSIFVLSPK